MRKVSKYIGASLCPGSSVVKSSTHNDEIEGLNLAKSMFVQFAKCYRICHCLYYSDLKYKDYIKIKNVNTKLIENVEK
jgi:hypothetical protein